MTRHFRRHGDAIRMELDPVEDRLLRDLRDGLRLTLADPDPDDAVVRRLFPAAVGGDDEADREVRELIHDDLLRNRLAGLDALVELLDRGRPHRRRLRVDLDPDDAALVLGVLNDVRLAIGARIGERALEDVRDRWADDASAAAAGPVGEDENAVAVMDHLAWLQEQLLAVLDPPSVTYTHEPD